MHKSWHKQQSSLKKRFLGQPQQTLLESQEEDKARAVVAKFGRDKLNEESSDVESILSRFKFIGLTKAFKKFQTQETLSLDEESAIINFANKEVIR